MKIVLRRLSMVGAAQRGPGVESAVSLAGLALAPSSVSRHVALA